MKLIIGLIVFGLFAISCQSHKPSYQYHGRRIASTPLLRIFIREIAQKSKKYTARELEEQVLNYIKRESKDSNYGNWLQIGISNSQAQKISSIYDDLPHMPKVRKWITENITKVIKIEDNLAREAFAIINKDKLIYRNPYSSSANKKIAENFKKYSPIKSISQKRKRVLDDILELDSKNKKTYGSLLVDFQRRGQTQPGVFSNGLESIESGAFITKKTGLPAYGKGCKSFNQKASFEVLEAKANVDAYRAKLVSEALEISPQKKLNQLELDKITERSFEDVLGYSNIEARAAVKRLKRKPCQVY